MKTRIKLAGSPLGYTFAQVDGPGDHYTAFSKKLWAEEGRAVPTIVKELIFMRSSIVNQCPT